jgi:3-hydroxy-4-methylanthranilate adenylyltransferase
MTTAAPDPTTHPLARTFTGPPEHVFLVDDRQAWTVARLLSLAGDIDRSVGRHAGNRVAVRARSSAFIVASLLALWKHRRHPLLLDPAVGAEAAARGYLEDGVPRLVPAWEEPSSGETAIAETRTGTFRPSLPASDDTILAFLTSGSTGAPKIVVKRDFQLQRQFAVEPAWLGVPGPIHTLSLVPAHHILGYIYGINMPASTGGRVVFPTGSSPHAWIDAVRRERPNVVVGVPLHYRLIGQALAAPLPKAVYLSSGGMLPRSVAEVFHERAGWPIVQVYGSTETAGIATRTGFGPWNPLPGVQWQVRDGDGRLVIRSPWQDPPSAWHHLDDLVEPSEGGFALLGRSDSVVKVGGRRFSLAEIVQTAQSSPLVEQAHAVTYSRYDELAVALFVITRQPTNLTAADVRSFMAERLASFKVPRTIRMLDELPALGIGKVDDAALRLMAGQESDGDPDA